MSLVESVQESLDRFRDPDPGLSAAALHAAKVLDAGAGLATAAVLRELRAALKTLKQHDDELAADDDNELLTFLRRPLTAEDDDAEPATA